MTHTKLFPSASYISTWPASQAEKRTGGSIGEYTRDWTGMKWHSKWWSNLPRATSKTEIVPSIEPQASLLPSGLQATESTNLWLPHLSDRLDPSGCGNTSVVISSHVAVSHNLIDARTAHSSYCWSGTLKKEEGVSSQSSSNLIITICEYKSSLAMP